MSYNTSLLGSYSSPSYTYYSSIRKKSYLEPELHSSPSATATPSSFATGSASRNLYETRRYLSDSFGLRSAPSHDKYGKELSNYERWKLQNGESISGLYSSKDVESEWRKKCNRRVSRALLGREDEEESREIRSRTIAPLYYPSTSGGFSDETRSYTPRSISSNTSIRSSLTSFPSEVREKVRERIHALYALNPN
eukprot:TRINITY_DN2517_c0_g1_i1.p1 TRINITY_DN2517_c0_g1~~TRINITY_DN2517_c0_g1_i1.p1  ORF type:complete len:195 (+),score=35.42 TRINITY_DN2517_c0_g1_i1:1277-1861(+)